MFGMTGDIIYYIDVYCIDIVQHRNNWCSPQNHGTYGNRTGYFSDFTGGWRCLCVETQTWKEVKFTKPYEKWGKPHDDLYW